MAESSGPPGAPRWVKASGAVILLVIAALVISKLAGVDHGPGMHSDSSATPAHTPGHTGPPPGVTHGSEE